MGGSHFLARFVAVVLLGAFFPLGQVPGQETGFDLLPFSVRKNITPYCSGFGADQRDPVIASDANGNLAVAWQDARNGYADVYVQFYAQGRRTKANQKVNQSPVLSFQSLESLPAPLERAFPSMHVNASGAGVIVWRQSTFELRGRLFDITTGNLGREFSVHANTDRTWIGNGAVRLRSDASFVVGWTGDPPADGTTPFMHYRCFSSSGDTSSEVRTFRGFCPVISGDSPLQALPDDRITALVSSSSVDPRSVFLEIIDRNGTLMPAPIEVFPSDPDPWNNSYGGHSSAVNSLGQVLCARQHIVQDDGTGSQRNFVEWRIVDTRFGTVSPMQSQEVKYGSDLQALRDSGTGFQLYWVDDNPEHVLACIDSSGRLRETRGVEHVAAGPARFQTGEARLLEVPVMGLLAVWTLESSESYSGRITHLRLTRGNSETNEFEDLGPISDDVCGAMEVRPAVFGNGRGRYLACWQNAPAGISMLNCQVLDAKLEAVGPLLSPNLEAEAEFSGVLDATAAPDGSFLLVYRSVDRADMGKLYLQRISADGELWGQSLRLDDTTFSFLPVTISCAGDGTVSVGYLDQGYGRTYTRLVRLVWDERTDVSEASESSWTVSGSTKTLLALDGNEHGDLLLAQSEFHPDSMSVRKDLFAVLYSTEGTEDTVITRSKSTPLLGLHPWNQFACAINAKRDLALCWTQVRYEGNRCINEEDWYVEPSLMILRAYAENDWRQAVESFPLRMDDNSAVTLQWTDAGGFLCTWSVADSCKGIIYDDASLLRETMSFHLSSSTELPTLDEHRAHAVVMDRQRACFLFESNDESGHGFDIHAKVYDVRDAAPDQNAPFSFDIFPAPANGHAVARFVLPEESRVVVRILDLLGRQLRTRDAGTLEGGGHFLELPIEGLAAGTYLISLTAHEQVYRSFVILPHR